MQYKKISEEDQAEKIKDSIVKEIIALNKDDKQCINHRPNLALVLFNNDKAAELHADNITKTAQLVGVDTHLYNCEAEMGQKELSKTIKFLNNDKTIDAIMLCTDKTIETIDSSKDINKATMKIPKDKGPITIAIILQNALELYKRRCGL